MAEDVLLSAAMVHFNAAPSFRGDGQELEAAQRWLDLMPWSSPSLEQERRLHEVGRLAYDLGASDLVPLQLRLRLESAKTTSDGGAAATVTSTGCRSGAIAIVRDVLQCNPTAYSHGNESGEREERGAADSRGSRHSSPDMAMFGGVGDDKSMIRTPPGTGLMRLAGLMGLASSDTDVDRVRALVARTALDNGDRDAACDILSASILRRPPRRAVVWSTEQAGVNESTAFAPELCDALDLIVRQGDEEWPAGKGHTRVDSELFALGIHGGDQTLEMSNARYSILWCFSTWVGKATL